MRAPFRNKLLTLVVASLGAAAAAAQPGTISERDYFEELPIVLSVSRLAQPLDEAPGAVTVIDREMIRLSGARHLIDLLRLVPGFQVASVPAPSGAPIAVYHGLTESYVRGLQVLLDGRSQYSPFFAGGVNWNQIPVSLHDIDHIEVVRGSNSAAYGANAVLGVVNIVTRHSQETRGAAAELREGTQGVNDKGVRLGAGGDDFSLRYTGEARFDQGLETFRDRTGQRLHDLRADWRLGPQDDLQIQLGKIATTMDVGTGLVTNPLRSQFQGQQYLALAWRHTLSAGEDVAVRYYRAEERASDAFAFPITLPIFVPPPPRLVAFTVPVEYGFQSVRNNLEATHTLRPWTDTRLVWGGEMRSDSVSSVQYYGRPDDVSLWIGRLFGNLEWRLARDWITNFGATWEHDTNSKTTFAPRLAVNWHAQPGQTLRAAVARAYRAPSLVETRGNLAFSSSTGVVLDRRFLARGGIKPEAVTSRELGWLGEFRTLKLTGDVRVFHERITDRVIRMDTDLTAPDCEATTPLCGSADNVYNAEEVRIRGIEYQWRWQPFEATRVILNQAFVRIGVDVGLSGAGITTVNLANEINKEIAQTATSAPTHATTLMLMQRLPGGIDLSLTYHSVGAMNAPDTGTYLPHWQRLDWRLGYPFRIGPTRGELAFTVQNDGKPHAENAPNELVSTRSFVTLRLDY